MYVPSQFRVARKTWAIRAISWQVAPPGPVGAHQMRQLYTFTTMINFRMQERCYGVTEEREEVHSMEPDRNQLKLLTPEELERLSVEARKLWAPAPYIEPLQVADAEAELDLR